MAWDDQQPPWGGKKGPQTPEDLIAALLNKIKDAFEGGKKSTSGGNGSGGGTGTGAGGQQPPGKGMFATIILVIVGFILVQGSYYTVQTVERGVVLRFGKYVKTAMPGLNFKIPLADQVVKVNVDTIRKEEFGFRTRIPGQRTQFEKRGFEEESLMLTSDRNVIDVEWIVQYKVADPIFFSFRVRDVPQAVRDISEMTMRRIVGNMDFDYVLSNRDVLAATSKNELQDALNRYEAGVDIVTVQLQDVNPPDAVKPAFNEVNEADQDMKRLVNEAEEAYNREVPKARGDAKKMLEEAHGYAIERVNEAKGNTVRFLAVLKEYKAAKDVTRRRLYLETMQRVLPGMSEIIVVDEEQKAIVPFMDVSGSGKRIGK